MAAAAAAGRVAWKSVVILVKCFSVAHVIWAYGGNFTRVDGPSMFPAFSGRGEWVLYESFPGLVDRLKTGDIVISSRPIAPQEMIIKRVAALEGQEVKVYRRGEVAPLAIQVPRGHIWLEGDNLIVSRDSREYGPVPLALLRGRVVAQVWPELKWFGHKKG